MEVELNIHAELGSTLEQAQLLNKPYTKAICWPGYVGYCSAAIKFMCACSLQGSHLGGGS